MGEPLLDDAAEQSSSSGLLISDQLNLSDGSVDIVFGCETKETGEIYNQEADGILGLGNSEVSLVNQVASFTSASAELNSVAACHQHLPVPFQAGPAHVTSPGRLMHQAAATTLKLICQSFVSP